MKKRRFLYVLVFVTVLTGCGKLINDRFDNTLVYVRCAKWSVKNTTEKTLYLFLWIFQGFCKELYLIHHFDSAVCFVNIHCAHRGVPPLAVRPSHEKFFHNCHDAGEYCFVYFVSLLMTENIRYTSFALRTFIILIMCLPFFSLRS